MWKFLTHGSLFYEKPFHSKQWTVSIEQSKGNKGYMRLTARHERLNTKTEKMNEKKKKLKLKYSPAP